jgi:tetratricopeptide (TPR) repeat protein
LLLVVEDLHWVDEQTQALLDGLAAGLASAPMVLLLTYRPEYRHGWGGTTFFTQLTVEPLPGEGAADLIDALLGADPSLAALKRLLIERTGGNPFFLEESVRSLIETGAVVGERRGHRLVADLPAIRMPATVQAVLAARIDRLAPEDKRLLQTAAVVGTTVPLDLLREVADVPTDGVQTGLERLRAADFLYRAGLFPEPEYAFEHALTHEVAYGGLLREHRRALHGRALEGIERLYRDRLDEHAERLAVHAMRAEAWAKAAEHGGRAGRKATFRSANREAVVHFERALEALEHLPESRGNLECAVDVRLDLRRALMPLGELERILHVLGEAEMRAEALGDQYRVGRVAALRANSYWWAGNHRMAVDGGQRALAAATVVGATPLQLEARQVLAHAYSSLGDYVRAADGLRANLAALADDPLRRPLGLASYPAVDAGAYLAWCLAHLGDYAEAIAVGERAVRHAEETRSPYDQSRALGLVAAAHLHRGNIATATAMLQRSADLCRAWGLAVNVRLDAIHLGTAYTMAGRPEEGLPLLEHAADAPVYRTRLHVHALALAALSAGYLAVGRVGDAARRATQALDTAVSQGEKSHEAYARHALGVIAAHHTPPAADEAEARYREALGQAEDLRMRPLQARCHLGLGKLFRRVGRFDEAHAELQTAVTMLRAVGMAFWLPETEGELAELAR